VDAFQARQEPEVQSTMAMTAMTITIFLMVGSIGMYVVTSHNEEEVEEAHFFPRLFGRSISTMLSFLSR
jgi:hypothetical protein